MREVRIVKNPFLASWFIPATLPFIRSRDICRSSEKAWESVEGPDMYSLCSLWMTFRKTVWNLMEGGRRERERERERGCVRHRKIVREKERKRERVSK